MGGAPPRLRASPPGPAVRSRRLAGQGASRGRGRPPHHLCGRASLVRRYCVAVGLAAGLAAAGFGAQKPGSAAMNSFGGLLIFGLTANSVNSLLTIVSACRDRKSVV